MDGGECGDLVMGMRGNGRENRDIVGRGNYGCEVVRCELRVVSCELWLLAENWPGTWKLVGGSEARLEATSSLQEKRDTNITSDN